jgi:hypothetical protein
MPSLANLFAFALVALGMVLTPGPNMIYLISRSIIQGRVAGLISLAGVALGSIFYMLCAAFGLTALVFAVPYAYDALRLTGAAYLLWLAWAALRPGGRSPFEVKALPIDSSRRLFAMGLLTNLQSENRDAVFVAAAAVHRPQGGQRAPAIARARIDADCRERHRQRDHRHDGWLNRWVPESPSIVGADPALADGDGSCRSRCPDGGGKPEIARSQGLARFTLRCF